MLIDPQHPDLSILPRDAGPRGPQRRAAGVLQVGPVLRAQPGAVLVPGDRAAPVARAGRGAAGARGDVRPRQAAHGPRHRRPPVRGQHAHAARAHRVPRLPAGQRPAAPPPHAPVAGRPRGRGRLAPPVLGFQGEEARGHPGRRYAACCEARCGLMLGKRGINKGGLCIASCPFRYAVKLLGW